MPIKLLTLTRGKDFRLRNWVRNSSADGRERISPLPQGKESAKIVIQPVFVQQHVFEGDFWPKFGTLNSICVTQKRPLVAKFQSSRVQTLPRRVQFFVSRFRCLERFRDEFRKNRTFTMETLSRARFYIKFSLF